MTELEIKVFLVGLELFFVRSISILIFSAIASLVICAIYRFFYCIYKLMENSEYGYESCFFDDLLFEANGIDLVE